MVLYVGLCSTKRISVRRSTAAAGGYVAFVDPLHYQGTARLLEELVVKPDHQAPHLDAGGAFGRKKAALCGGGAAGFVEIFGNNARTGHCGHTLIHQNRRGSRRIEHQELRAPFPHPLFDELWRQTVFFEHEAHEAGMWTNRMVEQRHHCATNLYSDLAEQSALPHDLER